MCRAVSTTLGADVRASALSRQFVKSALGRWDVFEAVDSALLVTSELVTNAVVHARTDFDLSLAVADGAVEIAVADRSLRLPRPRFREGEKPPLSRPQWLDEGGRGLLIVEALADEWGIAEERDGKRVWFRLGVDSGWAHHGSCPCADRTPSGAITLSSGRRAVHVTGPWDA
jgi:anti-sigma regulatory factor (Ser/Thr protein kinase)